MLFHASSKSAAKAECESARATRDQKCEEEVESESLPLVRKVELSAELARLSESNDEPSDVDGEESEASNTHEDLRDSHGDDIGALAAESAQIADPKEGIRS